MRLTCRTRKRILSAVLPLLAVVWSGVPWIPCFHEVASPVALDCPSIGDPDASDSELTPALLSDLFAPIQKSSEFGAETSPSEVYSMWSSVGFGQSVTNPNDLRFAPALYVLPPSASILSTSPAQLHKPHHIYERPLLSKRRPLHLSKAVLLI